MDAFSLKENTETSVGACAPADDEMAISCQDSLGRTCGGSSRLRLAAASCPLKAGPSLSLKPKRSSVIGLKLIDTPEK